MGPVGRPQHQLGRGHGSPERLQDRSARDAPGLQPNDRAVQRRSSAPVGRRRRILVVRATHLPQYGPVSDASRADRHRLGSNRSRYALASDADTEP